MDGAATIPYDENAVICGIACQTCGKELSLGRGKFPICDDCHADYFLNGKKICDNEKDGYVPDFLCPADSGYGDYMIMDINEEGQIADWNKIDFDDWVLTMKED